VTPIFAVLQSLDEKTYVRLPNGEWVEAWPGMTMWVDLPPATLDPYVKKQGGKHSVDDKLGDRLEADLARQRRQKERGK
jgi:hypothetical protein